MSLIVICNPLLDLSASVQKEILTKYDLKPANAILAEEKHLPLYDELINNYEVQYTAGGAGQNSARAVQWMMQKPNSTIYFGCIGKDTHGKKLREEATSDGVNVQYLEDDKHGTGTCACLITDKERSLVANLAAANHYKKENHYDSPEIQAFVNNAKFFYVTGFFLTVSPETILAVGKHSLEHNKTFLINLSAPFLIDFFFARMASVLPYVDVVFGNESEFGALGKKQGWGDDLKEIAKHLVQFPKEGKKPRLAVVTQGMNPTLVISSDGLFLEVPVPHVPTEEIIDTNGAGDSFVGGFLSQFIQGKSLEESVAAGHYCAGVTIRTSGIVFKGKTPSFSFSK